MWDRQFMLIPRFFIKHGLTPFTHSQQHNTGITAIGIAVNIPDGNGFGMKDTGPPVRTAHDKSPIRFLTKKPEKESLFSAFIL
jgi:hypothetical protein